MRTFLHVLCIFWNYTVAKKALFPKFEYEKKVKMNHTNLSYSPTFHPWAISGLLSLRLSCYARKASLEIPDKKWTWKSRRLEATGHIWSSRDSNAVKNQVRKQRWCPRKWRPCQERRKMPSGWPDWFHWCRPSDQGMNELNKFWEFSDPPGLVKSCSVFSFNIETFFCFWTDRHHEWK